MDRVYYTNADQAFIRTAQSIWIWCSPEIAGADNVIEVELNSDIDDIFIEFDESDNSYLVPSIYIDIV